MPNPIPAEVSNAIAPLIGTSSISSNKEAEEGEVGDEGCAIATDAMVNNTINTGNSFNNLLTGRSK